MTVEKVESIEDVQRAIKAAANALFNIYDHHGQAPLSDDLREEIKSIVDRLDRATRYLGGNPFVVDLPKRGGER